MAQKIERIRIALTTEQVDYLRNRFGENYDREKSAEVRRWTTLGWKFAQSGLTDLAGPRISLALEVVAIKDEVVFDEAKKAVWDVIVKHAPKVDGTTPRRKAAGTRRSK